MGGPYTPQLAPPPRILPSLVQALWYAEKKAHRGRPRLGSLPGCDHFLRQCLWL